MERKSIIPSKERVRSKPRSSNAPGHKTRVSTREPGEDWDDPHRMARLLLKTRSMGGDGPALLFWRDDWYQYTKDGWQRMTETEVTGLVASHCRDVAVGDYRQRVREAEGKKNLPKVQKVTNRLVADVLLHLRGMAAVPDRGEEPPFWLPTAASPPAGAGLPGTIVAAKNGLFRLDELSRDCAPFSPPTPAFFTLTPLPFPVHPGAGEPREWVKFLGEVFAGDTASRAILQEWFGYILARETRMQKILLLVGPTRSGKRTITKILSDLVGKGNVAGPTFASLGTQFGLSDLLGKTLAIISDARLSPRTDLAVVAERLLTISGEDALTIDRKYKSPVTARLSTRVVICTNELPRLTDASGAMSNRFLILPTPLSWAGREDRGLLDRLRNELPEILVWAAAGWKRLREQGQFSRSSASERSGRDLDILTSPIRAFVSDRCVLGPGHEVEVPRLLSAWKAWNEELGLKVPPDSEFWRDLRTVVPDLQTVFRRRDDSGVRGRSYRGIGLNTARQMRK